MRVLSGRAAPIVAPNPDAVRQTQVVTDIEVAGQTLGYQGEALEWDTAKSRTIALLFSGPWYSERTIELFVWSARSVKVDVSSPVLISPQTVDLQVSSAPSGHRVTLPIPEGSAGLVSEVRLYLSVPAATGASVNIGLDGGNPATCSQMRWHVVTNLKLAVLAATWAIAFFALFVIGLQTGTKTALYAGPAIAVLPGVLKALGASWANTFDVSRLALMIAKSKLRAVPTVWAFLGAPAALLMAYVATALAVYGVYYYRLQANGLSERSNLARAASLFCQYPERVEVRALLARSIHAANSAPGRANAYEEVTRTIPVARFLGECTAPRRITPLFYDPIPSRRDDARNFYASLWWNSISEDEHFVRAMSAIRQILREPAETKGLAALTLAKYELRSIKNQNEQQYCAGERAKSPDCSLRRKACAAARESLVRLFNQNWTTIEMHTVTYLEARDVAASSYMSPGCESSGPSDPNQAVAHLWALVAAIPRGEVVLDDVLVQINFRKYLDSQLEKRPGHQTSQVWQAECRQYHPDVCKLLHDTFINDMKQTFFTPNREQRTAEWEAPSIPALKGKLLEQRIEELSKKGWKWPLS